MIQNGVELVGIEAPVIGTVLIMPSILSQIANIVGLLLGFFLLPAAKCVVLDDVIQIADNRCAVCGLGMKSGYDAGDLFIFFVCIFMIQKEFVGFPANDNTPFTHRGEDVKPTIIQPAGHAIFLAEPVYGVLFFSEPHADDRAAIAHTITGGPGIFRSGKSHFVLFANATGDLAVRKVEYFLIALCAVKYHEGQLLFF